MDSQENNQLELFSQSNNSSEGRTPQPGISFFANIRHYEKTILIIIAIIIIGIISFSLGVEKGRKISPNFQQENEVGTISLQAAPKPKSAAENPKIQESAGGFTIQVASFKSKILAQQEAANIKKRGLNPTILTKGTYTAVCVGNFASKEKAQSALTELKRIYQDCYIRRL